MVLTAPPDLLDLRVKLVPLARLLLLTNPDLLVPLVPLVKMELQASLVALDPLAQLDLLDPSDLLADLAQTASQEAQDLKERLEIQASPEDPAKTDYLAPQADNLAQLARKDLKDPLASTALPAKMVSLVDQVLQAKTDSPVDLASLVKQFI